MEHPTRRLDLPAFPRSRSRPRHPGQLALSRLRRMGRLQLLVLLLQLGSFALLLRLADQVDPPPRHRWLRCSSPAWRCRWCCWPAATAPSVQPPACFCGCHRRAVRPACV